MFKFISALLLLCLSFNATSKSIEEITHNWQKELIKQNFSGLVLVSSNEQVIYQHAFGIANRERNIPFSNKTIFDIGSVTKQFTATAILKLQAQGKLATTDTLGKYFNDLPADKQDITIHHLLTHTAGLATNLGNGSATLYQVVTAEQLLDHVYNAPLAHQPGTKYNYSNIGYSVLSLIIEKASGMGYEEYFQAALFKPAGMTETGYRLVSRNKDDVTINYGADQTFFQRLLSIEAKSRSVGSSFEHLEQEDGPRLNMEGGGGLSSTLADLHRWHTALNSEAVIDNATKEVLFSTQDNLVNAETKEHYGYGWAVFKQPNGSTYVTHNGSNGYAFTDVHRVIEDNLFIVITTNENDAYPDEVMKKYITKLVNRHN